MRLKVPSIEPDHPGGNIGETKIATDTKPTSYIAAMKHFFGFKPEQTLMQFNEELKALSPEERDYFKAGLRANGYEIATAA